MKKQSSGKPIRFTKSVTPYLHVLTKIRPKKQKTTLGFQLDIQAALYAQTAEGTKPVLDTTIDADNVFRPAKSNVFSTTPGSETFVDSFGVTNIGVTVSGGAKAQLKLTAHLRKLTKLLEQEMSPERIREIVEAD